MEKRCEDMIPELEQMEKLKLFDRKEIRNIAKKWKEYEYKIHRHEKCKEDYLRYIQYEMNLLKLIKQRRDKYKITQKKSDIDYAITNKINNLYKDAISRFQDDHRFWIAYMKFCKHVHFHSDISTMLSRMLQIHGDKPECWHIAATWELEEKKNKHNAQQFLLRGLQLHPESQLLYIDAFKLELNNQPTIVENQESNLTSDELTVTLKKAYVIYQQAFENIKDIKFIVELLNIAKDYDNTENLQKKMICDMIKEYAHEALMWDTMARREFQGLVQPSFTDTSMELETTKTPSLRCRITSCNKVYQTAVKKIKTEEMWSLYIECLLEINSDVESLPNFKKKLLKIALMQAHRAKKLREKYYLIWIDMLSVNKDLDENVRKKLNEVLREATKIVTNSVNLWQVRINTLLQDGHEEEADSILPTATRMLGEKALSLWRLRILHAQIKGSEQTEKIFQAALKAHPKVAKDIGPTWLEWLVLVKGICAARKAYKNLCLQSIENSLELHKQMAALELVQPKASLEDMRKPYDNAILYFGKNNISIWLDYITFEINYGEPKTISKIYDRAIKTLDRSLTSSFIEEYTKAKEKFV